MPDTDAFERFVRAAKATSVNTTVSAGDTDSCTTPCPTNRRLFLQRSLSASIAASVITAYSKGSTKAGAPAAGTAAPAGANCRNQP